MGRGNDGLQVTFVDPATKTVMGPDNDVRGPCREPIVIVESSQIFGSLYRDRNASFLLKPSTHLRKAMKALVGINPIKNLPRFKGETQSEKQTKENRKT